MHCQSCFIVNNIFIWKTFLLTDLSNQFAVNEFSFLFHVRTFRCLYFFTSLQREGRGRACLTILRRLQLPQCAGPKANHTIILLEYSKWNPVEFDCYFAHAETGLEFLDSNPVLIIIGVIRFPEHRKYITRLLLYMTNKTFTLSHYTGMCMTTECVTKR